MRANPAKLLEVVLPFVVLLSGRLVGLHEEESGGVTIFFTSSPYPVNRKPFATP
jgi:hypothetical protein